MASITLPESLSYTVKDLPDQQSGDMHLQGNERGFQPQTINNLWSCLWTQLIQFKTKVMSGLCTKPDSWGFLCSTVPHQGQGLGKVYLQLRSPGEREPEKAGQTLPGKELASRYSNSAFGTCHALLPPEFSFTLSRKRDNVRQER